MEKQLYDKQMTLSHVKNEKERLTRKLEFAESKLETAIQKRDLTKRQLSKEQQDVVKLGKFSIFNKINELTGKWDQQMEKELAEVADAEVKYHEAEKDVIDLTAEVKRLQERLANPEYEHIEKEWGLFLEEKETWIRMHDSEANAMLRKIADERISIRSIMREVNEAEEAGTMAVKALNRALDKLGNAEGMSMWDTFLGGGLFVSALKYSEVGKSDDYIHRAERALRNFQTELMDVQDVSMKNLSANKKDVFAFTDLFFDNIFSDLVVHSRITDTKNELENILSEVRRVMRDLERKRDSLQEELVQLDKEEQGIIER
mgnify:CR=1 FL=1